MWVTTPGLGWGDTLLWCTSVTVLWGSMYPYPVGRGFRVTAADHYVCDGI